ncbi:polysaccharide deacetylase family protein [Demequina sp. NBRC 110054]|uniref:polysaccharide deacetylase family protein n=1 Tax=Demequina sp. NBRC 110054 TaxID=1570343 RepID=UPI00117809EC|nr:polysaccharide deacetylase family protein [Demequina sp. NBRC 110054]
MTVRARSKAAVAALAGVLLAGCSALGQSQPTGTGAEVAEAVEAVEEPAPPVYEAIDLVPEELRGAARATVAQTSVLPTIQDFSASLVGVGGPSAAPAEAADPDGGDGGEATDEGSQGTRATRVSDRDDADEGTDCSVEKCLALTFDDGPTAGTEDLLDVLAKRGVKATFFVVGKNASAHPEILERMVAEGHTVGNHSWSHANLTGLTDKQLAREINRTSDRIEQITGVRPTVLRPPYGSTGPRVAAVAEDAGMAQILWDVDPRDWKVRDAHKVTKRIVQKAHPGAIVLSHDIHETTRDAYAKVIDKLLAQGYTLVTVPDLLDDMEPGETYLSQ